MPTTVFGVGDATPWEPQAASTTAPSSAAAMSPGRRTGTVGPDLDGLKPNYQAVTAQVTNGGAGMPAFGKTNQLNTQQIADVAAYVVTSTGGTVP